MAAEEFPPQVPVPPAGGGRTDDLEPWTGAAPGSFDPRDVIPVPVLLITPQGRIAWINHAAERLLGLASDGVVGESFVVLLSLQRRRQLTTRILRRHLRATDGFSIELPIRTPLHAEHWVALQVQRVATMAGRWAYVACLTDLQQMHQALDAMTRRNTQLVAKVQQAHAASDMKMEFLTGISNELRAPLGGMLEMTRLLFEMSTDREQTTVAEILQDSSRAVLSLVDDMVDFAKIETGKLELVAIDFDLRLAVDAVASSLAADADLRSTQFRLHLDHSIPALLNGDPGRLRQVLLQVGRSCLRLAPAPSCVLTLRGESRGETAHEVEVEFTFHLEPPIGHAPGAPAAFAGLYSGDPSVASAHGGVGLGLAIAHHLIALLGGTTTVVDEPGAGWSLSLRIPIARQRVAQSASHDAPVVLADRRILALVERDLMWESLSGSIHSFGAKAELAPNMPAALQAIRTAASGPGSYVAVVAHLEMAGFDAARFARTIRREPAFDLLPLILITSLGRSGDSSLATEWGYSAYLPEPVTAELLRQTVEASTRLRRNAGGAPPKLVTRHSIAEESKVRRCVMIVDDSPLDHLPLVSALRRMGFASEVLANEEAIMQQLRAGSVHLLLVFYDGDRPEPSALVNRVRGSGDAIRNVPILAVASSDPKASASSTRTPDIDAVVDPGLDLGGMCSAIEGLLLHGLPTRVGSPVGRSTMPRDPAAPAAGGAPDLPDPVQRFVGHAEKAVAEICAALVADDPIRGSESVRRLIESSRGVAGEGLLDLLARLDAVFTSGRMEEASTLVFEMARQVPRELSALRPETGAAKEAA